MDKLNLQNIVFMYVGPHCGAGLNKILEEKKKCNIFWFGYGGNLARPNRTQEFAKKCKRNNQKLYLVAVEGGKDPNPNGEPMKEYSIDNKEYKPIPEGIEVKGSDFAYVCKCLTENPDKYLDTRYYVTKNHRGEELLLSDYGRNKETKRRRADKALAFYKENQTLESTTKEIFKVRFIAEIIEPYAVYLR